MTNETYEFIRITVYLLSALGLFYLGIIIRSVIWAASAISIQFIIRSFLLAIQTNSPLQYREFNNQVSTPLLFIVLIAIVYNLWTVRKL
jgi:hypothetical protein